MSDGYQHITRHLTLFGFGEDRNSSIIQVRYDYIHLYLISLVGHTSSAAKSCWTMLLKPFMLLNRQRLLSP